MDPNIISEVESKQLEYQLLGFHDSSRNYFPINDQRGIILPVFCM